MKKGDSMTKEIGSKIVRKEFRIHFWRRTYFPHIILDRPKEKYDIYKDSSIKRADDQIFIVDDSASDEKMYLLTVLVAYLFSAGFVLLEDELNEFTIFLSILSFLIGTFYFIYTYTHPKKILILDRLNGLITYPGILYSKPITKSFDKVSAILCGGGRNGPLRIALLYKYKLMGYDVILGDDPIKDWSFMVWYMDRNRPLPTGKIFDPYRKTDYERRKAEDFPEPLYESWIITVDKGEFQIDQLRYYRELRNKEKKRNKRNEKYK